MTQTIAIIITLCCLFVVAIIIFIHITSRDISYKIDDMDEKLDNIIDRLNKIINH